MEFAQLEKDAKKKYGRHFRPGKLKKHLKQLGLSCKQSKNVTNASNPATCSVRVDRVDVVLDFVEKNNIGVNSTKKLYFMDECNLNQLSLQNNTVVGPSNVEIYRPNHKTVVTESLTLILLVDHKCNVVHHHLYHNKVSGATNATRIVEFLREAAAKILTTDTHPLFLDNAPTHRSAFKHSKDLDKWQPLWAAPFTPETNLAEFFFRELKRKLRQDVNSIGETLAGLFHIVVVTVYQLTSHLHMLDWNIDVESHTLKRTAVYTKGFPSYNGKRTGQSWRETKSSCMSI